VRCPEMKELPDPPSGRTGWPWTEQSTGLPVRAENGQEWQRITVVTPSYNQGRFIEETIRSVLLQGYPNLEYIIMDGGSTDNSVEIIRRYASWLTHWVSEADSGQSDAINRGLRIGSGRFAAWVNSDDLLCKNALVEHARRAGFEDSLVYVGNCLYINESRNRLSRHTGRVHCFEDLVRIADVWHSGGHIVQPEVLFPRELALAVGGLNVENHHSMDFELWGRLLLSGARIRYTGVDFGTFRKHEGQKIGNKWKVLVSMVDAARSLVREADSLPMAAKQRILADLEAYREAYWKETGGLARARLPRRLVCLIRSMRRTLRKATWSLLSVRAPSE